MVTIMERDSKNLLETYRPYGQTPNLDLRLGGVRLGNKINKKL